MSINTRGATKKHTSILSFIAIFFSSVTFAWEGEYGIRLSAEKDDNVAMALEDEQDSTTKEARLIIDINHAGNLLTASIAGTASKQNYSSDDVDSDETQIEGRANLNMELVPKRFFWSFENSAAVGIIDPQVADTPENRTQTNRMSTGPDLSMTIAPGTEGYYQFRLSKETIDEEGVPDSERQVHILGASRAFTRTLDGGISLESSKFDSDNDVVDNTTDSISLTLTNQFTGSVVSFSAGQSEVKVDQSGSTRTSDIFSVIWDIPLANESSFVLAGSQRVLDSSLARDTSNDLVSGTDGGTSTTTPFNNLIELSIIEARSYNATYSGRPFDFDLELQLFASNSKEIDSDFEYDQQGYFARVAESIGRTLISFSYRAEEYTENETGADDSTTESSEASLEATRLIGRSVTAGVFLRAREQSDSVTSGTAKANSVGLYVELRI